MGVLIGLLINALTNLFTKTFLHAAFKIAITLAFIALVVAAVLAYVSAARLIINSISETVPDIVNGVWMWVMPANTSLCLTALSAAILLRFFTNQYRLLINAKFRASISN